MLFHELATNAAKYGAFSNGEGTIAVHWSLADSRLNLEWHESGGPPVREPERRGFGTQLINSALGAFGVESQAHFEPTGIVVHIQVERFGGRLRVVEQEPPRDNEVAV